MLEEKSHSAKAFVNPTDVARYGKSSLRKNLA
jgi:hypothetical protein